MATAYERLYEISLAALEQQAGEIKDARSGIPAIGAAAAVIGALTKAAFQASGTPNRIFAVLGATGIAIVLICAVQTLRTRGGLRFSFDSEKVREENVPMLEQPDVFHSAMAKGINEARIENKASVRRVRQWYAGVLLGLIIEAVGLVVAAVVHF